ncbi:unnamed protein product [Victoria cruziana]
MSLQNLLCGEDASFVDSDECAFLPSESDFPVTVDDDEEGDESVSVFIGFEGEFLPGIGFPASLRSRPFEASARRDAVDWILEVRSYYSFCPLTAYLAVNYMDRFLSVHCLPQASGWPMQLLSVACLSLAAKMEETVVPSLVDLQVGQAKFIFEPRTICRMELLILTKLNWKLRSVTPFNFIDAFARKIDPRRLFTRFLVSRANQLILDTIRVVDFGDFRPSSIAAAATLCSADEIPDLARTDHGSAASWGTGMDRDNICNCCKLMQHNLAETVPRRASMTPPKFRVTIPQSPVTVLERNEGSSAVSSSPSYSSSNKRRRLN